MYTFCHIISSLSETGFRYHTFLKHVVYQNTLASLDELFSHVDINLKLIFVLFSRNDSNNFHLVVTKKKNEYLIYAFIFLFNLNRSGLVR